MGEFADEAIDFLDRYFDDFEGYPLWKAQGKEAQPLDCLETSHLINIRKCIKQGKIDLGKDNEFFVSCIEDILEDRGINLIPVKNL